jgi:N-carbamoyl-L-amino-acid hydrolase
MRCSIDAVGNVVGRYKGDRPGRAQNTADRQPLRHRAQRRQVRRAPGHLRAHGLRARAAPRKGAPAVRHRGGGFAEEEGQRYKATFLGSGALIGHFNPAWLDQKDADGITMREAMQHAGLCVDDIASCKRDPADYLGFVEVHIEQGPVLNELDLPLGVVTSINGSVRYLGEVIGMASHAGTTPMDRRRDAACAVAELVLYVEQRAAQDGDSVGTMGQLNVPNGSINVVPGRCQFSLDLRAPTDAQRDALVADVLAQLQPSAPAAACATRWKKPCAPRRAQRTRPGSPLGARRAALGVPVFRMPSGAGHDAMKLHEVMPQAMLFVRGENAGISHNPLESTTSDDMQLAVDAFTHLLDQLDRIAKKLNPLP